jgi:hypothetical protein
VKGWAGYGSHSEVPIELTIARKETMQTDYTRRIPVDKITRTRNPVRSAFHGLICVLGWAAFAYYLYTVLLRPLEPDAILTFLLLLLLAGTIAVVNQIWIWFNRDLNQKLGRRREARLLEYAAKTDQIGRWLEGANWPVLRQSGRIWIEIDAKAGAKRYRRSSPPGEKSQVTDSWNG